MEISLGRFNKEVWPLLSTASRARFLYPLSESKARFYRHAGVPFSGGRCENDPKPFGNQAQPSVNFACPLELRRHNPLVMSSQSVQKVLGAQWPKIDLKQCFGAVLGPLMAGEGRPCPAGQPALRAGSPRSSRRVPGPSAERSSLVLTLGSPW